MAPRVSVTSQPMLLTGLAPTLTGPTVDGDVADVARGTFLMVVNGSGSSINVTVQTPVTVEDLAVADRVVAVAAGATKFIPLTMAAYKQLTGSADAGRAYVDYSAITTVTRAVVTIS